MTAIPPCTHGMPSPASCTTCMDLGPVAPARRWQWDGRSFNAAHPGQCERCDDQIVVGERIAREDFGDERTRYVHIGCRA